MPYAFTNPHAANFAVCVGQQTLFEVSVTAPETEANLELSVSTNSGAFVPFSTGSARAVLTQDVLVRNTDRDLNAGADGLVVKARDTSTGFETTIAGTLVGSVPWINCAEIARNFTSTVADLNSTPRAGTRAGGAAGGPVQPTAATLADEDNQTPDGEPCPEIPLVVEEGCPSCEGAAVGCPTCGGGASVATVAVSGDGEGAGLFQPGAMLCNLSPDAKHSLISTALYGRLQVKTECATLPTRGEPIPLCVYFLDAPDGLVASGERPAGIKRSFGWQVRLIEDLAGNVAIYWGDRRVEGWKTDGAGGFTRPRGTFGTLTKQGGTYTRTTKDCLYFDFDANGRLQTIKDRSPDGNVIYYNYNGTNQMVRITGPGLGFVPYFTYDAGGRVNAMSLEWAAAPSKNRVTYYDYDASGRMNKIVGPESCITYFDHNAQDNLTVETDPDNYRAYFEYGSEPVPRVRKIHLPESQVLYFNYNDTVPRTTKILHGCGAHYYDYQWAGMAEVAASPITLFYTFCPEGQMELGEGPGNNKCYYTWDGDGQMTSQKCCEDFASYFTYGSCGTVTSRKDPLGRVTYWNYDANGLQKNWIDALGNVTYFERDSFGKMVSKKDRRGNVTYFTYDASGDHTSTKWPDGSVRYYDYTPAGEVEVLVDELGNVAYYDRDKRGRITTWKDFLGQATQFGYDNRSNLTVKIDRRSNAWYWEYDGLSRNTIQRTALLNTSYFNYNTCNVLASRVDPGGNPTYFYYNNSKQLVCRENALQERTYFTYTAAGQIESVKDAKGCFTYYTYDCHYRQTSMKDGEGNVTYYDYDRAGNRDRVTNPRSYLTYFNFDALDRLVSTRDPLLQQNYFYYDAESNRTASEDALQRRTYFYYDSRDRQFCAEDAQQNRMYFTYEARSLRSSKKDTLGNVTYFYQDKNARRFAVRDARNNVAYVEYDAEANQTSTKDPRGNVSTFVYDKDNRQVSSTTPLNETTYFAYDAASNRFAVQNARNYFSYFYFDALNRMICSEDAKKARTYFTFDAVGNRSSIKDPIARVTYYYHDCIQRQFAVRDALNGLRYFTFDRASNRDSVKDERGNVTYFYFDELDRVFGTRNAVQALSYFTFDAVGNRTSSKDSIARFNYFYYDSLDRNLATEDGLQKRTYFTYDAMSNTISIKNPRREGVTPVEVGVQYFTYDALLRRNSFKDEVGNVWYFDYDAASNLFVQRNARGAFTYWKYDALNRKQSQKDPLARSWYWTYDVVGNANSMKDGKAQVTYYQFDEVDLQNQIDYPDATKHYFEYDMARQMTAFADPTGRTVLGYDDLGRLKHRLNPGSQNLYYEYDAVGNRTLIKDPDGFVIEYSFDPANRMSEAGSDGYGVQPYGRSPYGGYVTYYQYDLADQLLHERRANKTVTYMAYDAASRTSLIQHRKSDGTVIERYDYTRDEAGNILRQLRNDGTNVYFNYDSANRITKEAWRTSGNVSLYGWSYSYDEAWNRIYKSDAIKATTTYWEYDAADQMTLQRSGAPVAVYFTFDNNGNLSVEHDPDPSAGRTYYNYDPRNLLIRVDFPGAIPTNYFEFNAVPERTRKDDSTGGKKYTWDGIVQVLEKNLSDSTTQRMVKGYTPVVGIGHYAEQDLQGTVLSPHKNQVGTTQRCTTGSEAITNYYEYDAWGVPVESTQGSSQQYRFTGKELDPDSVGLNMNNARHHFPLRAFLASRGSFSQLEPLVVLSFPELILRRRLDNYGYSEHCPVRLVDPLGLQGEQEDKDKFKPHKSIEVAGHGVLQVWVYTPTKEAPGVTLRMGLTLDTPCCPEYRWIQTVHSDLPLFEGQPEYAVDPDPRHYKVTAELKKLLPGAEDQVPSDTEPFYWDTKPLEGRKGLDIKSKSPFNTHPIASFIHFEDSPHLNLPGKDRLAEFETCLVCVRRKDKTIEILRCIQWGYRNQGGKASALDLKDSATASDKFKETVNEFLKTNKSELEFKK